MEHLYFWSNQDLTVITGGAFAAAGSALTSYPRSGTVHAFYIGTSHYVYQMYWNTPTWVNQVLPRGYAMTGSPLTSFANSNGEHVYIAGLGWDVYELYWNGFSWLCTDLTAGTQC